MFNIDSLATSKTMRSLWKRLSTVPGGKALFSKMLGQMAPYTGTIKPRIIELEPGYSLIQIHDRRQIRNHLHSIHAVALLNLAEISTGVAMMFSIPDDARGILAGISIEYIKKGRGTLTAETRLDPPTTNAKQEYQVEATIRDDSGDVVAEAKARWLISPKTG